jgi:uncharacterized protein YndB with AHSA1/START domain
MKKLHEPAQRAHEHTLDIATSPADVWKAITTAEELVRWFPIGAETRPGLGGEILYQWGELEGRCRILAWDPPRHLRTGWMEAPSPAAQAPDLPRSTPADEAARAALVVDWFLEGHGGMTHLRLVHSGFSADAAWDKEYDGTKRGWTFELEALKHYLEQERGQDRRASWIRHAVTTPATGVWSTFSRPGKLFRALELAGLAHGDRFRLERVDGVVLTGRVLVNRPPLEFAGVLDDGAMLRFGFEDCMGRPEAHVWFATWGLSAERFTREEQAWRAILGRAFSG